MKANSALPPSKAIRSAKPSGASATSPFEAIAFLTAEHEAVKVLFDAFRKVTGNGNSPERKAALVRQICDALAIHTRLEEEIFFPAIREVLAEEVPLDEAAVVHEGAEYLIAQLRAMQPCEEHYDAKVALLAEFTDHHVRDEEAAIFPKVRNAGLQTEVLGSLMYARRQELQGQVARPEADGH